MDLNNEYKLMCLKADDIQNNWQPIKGDFMCTKHSYCHKNQNGCTDNDPCIDCLKMGNVYVISGEYSYHESVGGIHWFFGGNACVRGEGNLCNDTQCYIMTESGYSTISSKYYTSSKSKMLWLPRQDQIQDILRSHYDYTRENIRFDFHLFNAHKPVEWQTWTDEMLWLTLCMSRVYSKRWIINEWSKVDE